MASNDSTTINTTKSPTASRFLAGASSLVLLQVLTRIVTFLLNQALVRLSTPQVFGTAAIQFELLLSSILFISREGVRLALLRTPDDKPNPSVKNSKGDVVEQEKAVVEGETTGTTRNRKQKRNANKATTNDSEYSPSKISSSHQEQVLVSNIATLPFLVGIPLAAGLSIVYATTASEETRTQPYFYASILAYTISALLQLAAEPMYILAQQELNFAVRMAGEAAGVIFRAAVTVAILSVAKRTGKLGEQAADEGKELGLLSFALGQLAYGVIFLAIYLWTYRSRMSEWRWWPKSVKFMEKGHFKTRLFDPVLLTLSKSMTAQSLVKHLLTEGDKVAVSRTSKLADQGGYAVASNYGSLVARIIFQPFEEMSRLYFSKTLAICTADEDKATVDQQRNLTPRDSSIDKAAKAETESIPLSDAQKAALKQASTTLHALLLLESHLLLILLTFLPPYLPILLSHFLPKKYLATSAPSILQAYAYYLPTMSLNGLLEAFAFSVMSPSDVKIQTRWLFVTSFSFAVFVWLFCDRLGLSEVGLVFANVASLGMRAAWAALFSDRWFKRMWSRGESGSKGDASSEKRAAQDLPTGISLRQILPPFSVLVLFAITSQITRYSQRFFHLADDNLLEQRVDRDLLKAQIQHVIVGGICGVICLAECYRSQRAHLNTFISLVRSRSA